MKFMRKESIGIFGIFLLTVAVSQFVYASPAEDSGFILLKQYNASFGDYGTMEIYDYSSPIENYEFKVQITKFDDKSEVDGRIKNNVEKSSSNREIDGYVVFMDENERYVFWREDSNFIQIIAMPTNVSISDRLGMIKKYGGPNIYPEALIGLILEVYPSECTPDGCLSEEALLEEKLREDREWFFYVDLDIEILNSYEVHSDCPIDEGAWEEIYNNPSISKEEMANIVKHCEGHSKYMDKQGNMMPEILRKCWDNLNEYVSENFDGSLDEEITLEECLIREKFIDEHNGYEESHLKLVFDERDKEVLRFLERMRERDEAAFRVIIYRNQSLNVQQDQSTEGTKEDRVGQTALLKNNNVAIDARADKEELLKNFNSYSKGKIYLNNVTEQKPLRFNPDVLNRFITKTREMVSLMRRFISR